jgi:hypothetical protein
MGRTMRKPLRRVIAALQEAGFCVNEVRQGGRHTEVRVLGGGVIRLHRGTRMNSRFERGLRANIRRLAEGEM